MGVCTCGMILKLECVRTIFDLVFKIFETIEKPREYEETCGQM